MAEYKDLKTGAVVTVAGGDKFTFPTTGAKILLKITPPIVREFKTD
jgi:hypothetical protein